MNPPLNCERLPFQHLLESTPPEVLAVYTLGDSGWHWECGRDRGFLFWSTPEKAREAGLEWVADTPARERFERWALASVTS